jgi:hypothetical protein
MTALTIAHATLCLTLLTALTPSAQAQVPPDPYNYSRASSFTYRADGLLQSQTVEPNNPNLCVLTTYGYDGTGNRNSAKTENCTGYSGRAKRLANLNRYCCNWPTLGIVGAFGCTQISLSVTCRSWPSATAAYGKICIRAIMQRSQL